MTVDLMFQRSVDVPEQGSVDGNGADGVVLGQGINLIWDTT